MERPQKSNRPNPVGKAGLFDTNNQARAKMIEELNMSLKRQARTADAARKDENNGNSSNGRSSMSSSKKNQLSKFESNVEASGVSANSEIDTTSISFKKKQVKDVTKAKMGKSTEGIQRPLPPLPQRPLNSSLNSHIANNDSSKKSRFSVPPLEPENSDNPNGKKVEKSSFVNDQPDYYEDSVSQTLDEKKESSSTRY
ncbi:hypothetical protein RFI_23987, partial [Reticulomyxa filosa]